MADPARTPAPPASKRPATGTGENGLPRRPTARRRLGIVLDSVSGPVPALLAAWLSALALTSALSPVLAVVIGIGFVGAFVAGLVGIGGAIILIPMLIYGPHLVGHEGLDIHAASGVTMVQVAVAGVTGMLAHRRLGNLDVPLTATLGGSMAFGSLIGGLTSSLVPEDYLSALFASLAAAAAALMLAGPRTAMKAREGPVSFNAPAAAAAGLVIGTLVGMVGAGGGFLLVPIMIFLFRIPVRVAVGSTLAIVAASGVAGSLGKAVTGQVEWLFALALVVGALPGAHLGARLSRLMPVRLLARLLGLLIAGIAAKMWVDLLMGR